MAEILDADRKTNKADISGGNGNIALFAGTAGVLKDSNTNLTSINNNIDSKANKVDIKGGSGNIALFAGTTTDKQGVLIDSGLSISNILTMIDYTRALVIFDYIRDASQPTNTNLYPHYHAAPDGSDIALDQFVRVSTLGGGYGTLQYSIKNFATYDGTSASPIYGGTVGQASITANTPMIVHCRYRCIHVDGDDENGEYAIRLVKLIIPNTGSNYYLTTTLNGNETTGWVSVFGGTCTVELENVEYTNKRENIDTFAKWGPHANMLRTLTIGHAFETTQGVVVPGGSTVYIGARSIRVLALYPLK